MFVELNKRLAAWKNIYGMLEGSLAHGQRQRTVASNLTRRWAGSIGLAAAVGLAYFLAALLSYGLALQSEGLAVFWPASGVSSGLLIALGSRARWPVVSGVIVAVVADHLIMVDPLRVGIAFALSDAAETLIIAGLIERYFGAEFSLGRLRHVLGMLAAAVIGTCVSGIRRGCRVRAATTSHGTDPDHLGALGHSQHNRLHCGCTAADWARRCPPPTTAEQ